MQSGHIPERRAGAASPARRGLGFAAAVVALLIAATSVLVAVPTVGAASKVAPVQSGFLPALITKVPGSSELLVLGSRSCKKKRCLELWRGEVGGRHFSKITPPHSTAPTLASETGSVGSLVFASPSDGYAIPPAFRNVGSAASLTRDGGRSWHSVAFPKDARVVAMTAAGGFFDAVVATCPTTRTGKCHDYRLERSRAGSRSWTSRALPDTTALDNTPVGLGAFKSTVFVSLTPQKKRFLPLLLVSSGGGPFAIRAEPALATAGSCSLWPTSVSVVWAECPTGMMESVERGVGTDPRFTSVFQTSGTGGSAFAPVTSTLAFRYTGVASPLDTLERTTDGGVRFSVMSKVASHETDAFGIAFSSQSRGDLLVSQLIGKTVRWSVLATEDGGRRLRRVTF